MKGRSWGATVVGGLILLMPFILLGEVCRRTLDAIYDWNTRR